MLRAESALAGNDNDTQVLAMQREHDLTVVGWRAWYSGGRTFDSVTTTWSELPADGALYFLLYHRTRPYCRSMCGRSLYWQEPTANGPIYAYDDSADAIISQETWQANRVKRGKWVTDNEMQEVRLAADKLTQTAPDEALRIDSR